MDELIERLERAERGSYELDDAVYEHLINSGETPWAHLCFTQFIDAALTLVPEGWGWQVSDRAPKPHCGRAYLHNRELQLTIFGGSRNPAFRHSEETAATPALALTIAALKARASKEPGNAPAQPKERE